MMLCLRCSAVRSKVGHSTPHCVYTSHTLLLSGLKNGKEQPSRLLSNYICIPWLLLVVVVNLGQLSLGLSHCTAEKFWQLLFCHPLVLINNLLIVTLFRLKNIKQDSKRYFSAPCHSRRGRWAVAIMWASSADSVGYIYLLYLLYLHNCS